VSTRERYVVDGAADGAAGVCEAIFEVLGPLVEILRVDAYSDFTDQMPTDIRTAQSWLRARGFDRGDGDPGISIVIEASDEIGRGIVRAYAPWSIRTTLVDSDGVNIATLDDGGHSVVVDVTADEAVALAAALGPLSLLVPLSD
jgi:hypothetical protein